MWRRIEGEWLDFVADVLASPLTRWPDERIVSMLTATLGAPAGAYYQRYGHAPPVQRQWPAALFADHHAEIARWTEQEAPTAHPVLRYYLATGDMRPMQVADVPSRFADARVQSGFREWCRSIATLEHQIGLPVRIGPHVNRSIVIGRPDPYSPAEVAFCRRVQRVLVGLDRQISAYARWSTPGGQAVAASLCLTPRELVVLDLLATGLTAAAIARRLGIAERTVQKHLQRVYAKLGATDRLGAVLRAQHAGLLRT